MCTDHSLSWSRDEPEVQFVSDCRTFFDSDPSTIHLPVSTYRPKSLRRQDALLLQKGKQLTGNGIHDLQETPRLMPSGLVHAVVIPQRQPLIVPLVRRATGCIPEPPYPFVFLIFVAGHRSLPPSSHLGPCTSTAPLAKRWQNRTDGIHGDNRCSG